MKHEALEDFINSMPTRLTKALFLKIYGYELTWPGSAERCLQKLEALGSSKARGYYDAVVIEYEARKEEATKEVAAWYATRLEQEYKGVSKWDMNDQNSQTIQLLKQKRRLLLKRLEELTAS